MHIAPAQVNSQCCEDNPDALIHHELLLPGHLMAKVLKERLEDCLRRLKSEILKDLENRPEAVNLRVRCTPKHFYAMTLSMLQH